MPPIVTAGAALSCAFGLAPSVLVCESTVLADELPVATIMDFVPIENIPPFGMCSSILNPEVVAATTAALGVLTPMPCVPVLTAPWIPIAPTILVDEMPVLVLGSVCMCDFGGVITIDDPGQVTVEANE
ncbi:MAG: DUF4280 domain-containing protein [Actinomycetota bacterium]|nr:DUF4280 domain-containing protein [Actinomycetota bacterium]